MKKLIMFLLMVYVVVGFYTAAVSVPCCWCGNHAEYQPRFVWLGFPLPNVIHFQCSKEADLDNLPYTSYPSFARSLEK
jgi:hypothetical protein